MPLTVCLGYFINNHSVFGLKSGMLLLLDFIFFSPNASQFAYVCGVDKEPKGRGRAVGP